jgi:hypothetical protein
MISLRTTLVLTGLLIVAEAVVLTVWGPVTPGPLVSGCIQLSLGLLCMTVAIAAARRGGGNRYERRFLLLVAARLALFSVAQILATYYLLDASVPFTGSLSDVLFHLEDVPLGIAFILDPGGEADRHARLHLLDLAQVVIFWATMALYVRYLSSDAPVGVGLVAGTGSLVAGCFYLRALTSRSTVTSSLYGRWTLAILLSAVNDAYSGFYNSNPGQPFDLVWLLEMVVWILTVATWSPMRLEPAVARRTVARTLSLLPLVVACFSLVLGLGLAQRRPALAGGLVAAAAICAALRLRGRLRRRSSPAVGTGP